MRLAVFSHLNLSPAELHALAPGSPGVAGRAVGLSLGIVAAMGVGMVGIAIAEFNKTE